MINFKTVTLNYHEIIDLIPHRYPFLFIDKVEQIVIAPEISLSWEKIIPVISSKNQIINLIGHPNFVDNHNYQKLNLTLTLFLIFLGTHHVFLVQGLSNYPCNF